MALILVIGLLALMMVMGMAFSVFMRTERVASGNFNNDVKVRQLLYAALNRALQDIEANVGTSSYPPWYVTNSTGYGDAMAITNGLAWKLLPTAALGSNTTLRSQWIDIAQSGVEGRVAFLTVNCSGLLDANHAGGADRSVGTNSQEIQVLNLPEMGNEAVFAGSRKYLTQQELLAVGTNTGGLRSKPVNFVTYSAFPTGNLVNVGGSSGELLTNQAAIIAGFVNSGFSVGQAGILFTNLIDYVDEDSIPGNLGNAASPGVPEGPFVEPVWMFNEFFATNVLRFTSTGSNYILSGQVTFRFEHFYPFVEGDASSCVFNYSVAFTNYPSASYIPSANPHARGGINISAAAAPGYWVRNELPVLISGGTVFSLPASPFSIGMKVSAWVSKGGTLVDVCTNLPVVNVTFPVPVASGTNYVTSGSACLECREPRRNSESTEWLAPVGAINSLGSVNTRTLSELTTAPGWQGKDGDTAMFVANRPLLTAGELGFLFFGNRWETIRLYKHGSLANPSLGRLHPVLDYFTAETGTNAVVRGKVHAGSRQRDVLAAVYDDMPIDTPGAGSRRVTGPLLDSAVDAVLTMTVTNSSVKLSDLGNIDWASIYPAATYPGSSDLDREAFVRNVSGLFGSRHNYFIILLYAQSTKMVVGLPDKSVLSGVRAVAEVWRDPVKNAEGRNAVLLRTFKILND